MTRRKGHTLIEAVTVFALMGTVMTTVAVSMSGMHRANQRVRHEIAAEREMQRFADLFRSDAHQAQSASLEKDDEDRPPRSVLLVLGDDQRVRYQVTSDGLQREHRRGDERVHHESFALAEELTAYWELDESGSAAVVTLTIEPDSSDIQDGSNDPTIQIQAAVGVLGTSSQTKDS